MRPGKSEKVEEGAGAQHCHVNRKSGNLCDQRLRFQSAKKSRAAIPRVKFKKRQKLLNTFPENCTGKNILLFFMKNSYDKFRNIHSKRFAEHY